MAPIGVISIKDALGIDSRYLLFDESVIPALVGQRAPEPDVILTTFPAETGRTKTERIEE